jgi:hypothetical protein
VRGKQIGVTEVLRGFAVCAATNPYRVAMSLPPTPTSTPDEVVGALPPRRPVVSVTIDWSQLPSAATALGVSLVSAAVVLSAGYSRQRGDLDGSNFTMGVLATLGLLVLAVAGHLLLPGSARRPTLVSWSGAAGVLGTGLMLGVLITNDDLQVYVAGVVIVVASVAGYLLTRATPFVLTAIVGLALLYAQAFDDVINTDGDGENTFMVVGAGVLVFVVGVTAAGWFLPATRVVTGIVVGVGGLVAMVVALEVLTFFRSFGAGIDEDASYADYEEALRHNPYQNDVYVILLYCAALAALWIGCSLATGHVGFRLLVLATALTMVPLAAAALVVSHPTWWEVVACGLGALALVGAAYRSKSRGAVEAPSEQ